jgi:membrane associated rhomboid family serine protease
MSRYAPRPAAVHYSFGPGPITPAVKWLIIANVAMFLATWIYEPIILFLGLTPRIVIEQFWIWQLATYAFLHGGAVHILFNMLGIWMFGVELERLWGTRQFVKYYAITGVGAGLTVLAVGLVLGPSSETYRIPTIGASGALYGLLVAFAYYYPDRPLLMFFLFPIPAKYFVMIVGAMAFLSAPQSRVSEAAHLGGLVIGYL